MNQRTIENLEELQDLPEGETAKWVHPENGTTHVFEFVPSNNGCSACDLDKLNHNCTHFCDSEYRKDEKDGTFVELPEEAPNKTTKIEFRAWDKVNKGWCFYTNVDCMVQLNNENCEITQLWRTWNGVKLFVGDIAQIGGHLVVIRFDEVNARFCFAKIDSLRHERFMDINQSPDIDWWMQYA